MISANSALKLLTAGIAAVTVASGCATAKKGEMAEAAAASTAPAAVAATPMAPETYTVKQHDNLWHIAGHEEPLEETLRRVLREELHKAG